MSPLRLAPFAFALALVAVPAGAGSGWSEAGRLAELQADDVGRLLFRLEVAGNPSGCREAQWFYRDPGAATAQMLEILLAGARTGRPLRAWVTGSCNLRGHAEISAVSLAP